MGATVAATYAATRIGAGVGGRADSDLEGRAGSEASRPVWPQARTEMACVQVRRDGRPDG